MAQCPVEMMIHCTLDFPVGQSCMGHQLHRAFPLGSRLARLVQRLQSGQRVRAACTQGGHTRQQNRQRQEVISIFTIYRPESPERFPVPVLWMLMFLPARFFQSSIRTRSFVSWKTLMHRHDRLIIRMFSESFDISEPTVFSVIRASREFHSTKNRSRHVYSTIDKST